jgi:hypothetical protein
MSERWRSLQAIQCRPSRLNYRVIALQARHHVEPQTRARPRTAFPHGERADVLLENFSLLRGKQDEKRIASPGNVPETSSVASPSGAPVASLILRPSRSSFSDL